MSDKHRDPEKKKTFRLEMKRLEDLRPKAAQIDVQLVQVAIPCPELNWFFHEVIGVPYRWGGREGWSMEDWRAYAHRKELETWVAYVTGCPAGYFELERQLDRSVRIECIGLMKRFIGQGLGGYLLTQATTRAWGMGAESVWLSTCSHDHPHALQNYLDRGYQLTGQTEGPVNPVRRSVLPRGLDEARP